MRDGFEAENCARPLVGRESHAQFSAIMGLVIRGGLDAENCTGLRAPLTHKPNRDAVERHLGQAVAVVPSVVLVAAVTDLGTASPVPFVSDFAKSGHQKISRQLCLGPRPALLRGHPR